MRPRLVPIATEHSPQSLAAQVRKRGSLVLLESCPAAATPGRYSLLACDPALVLRTFGARCELISGTSVQVLFGNPWRLMEALLARFDLPEGDLPLPAGAAIGYWGYELRQFVEPKLRPHPHADVPLPDSWLGFYPSLVAFDHLGGRVCVIATGLDAEGSASALRAQQQVDFWRRELERSPDVATEAPAEIPVEGELDAGDEPGREAYLRRVRRALDYIRQGDIYQVNLARRWSCSSEFDVWRYYTELTRVSPAPFAAFLEGEDFAIASSSPEQFLQFDGQVARTRPIKGTRPRGSSAAEDARLGAELAASAKERAELTMITDLLRNDLGRVCEFGSVRVPALAQLERFAQVQHLVSTVEGRLRPALSHVAALEACFPGGSVTGAPKFRALQLIDELEPFTRGPYTGGLGYLGFNRRSQLSMIIRTLAASPGRAWLYAGAGIVADSEPEAEHAETLIKARALREVLDKVAASPATMARHVSSRMAA